MTLSNLPTYSELKSRPHVDKNKPPLETWSLFPDKSLGRLALLDADNVLKAQKLIQTGEVVNLDWSIDKPTGGCFARGTVAHEIISFPLEEYGKGTIMDDTLELNTQAGSQWDGLWHFADRNIGVFYGGLTVKDIAVPSEKREGGMSAWANHGIVGRAVLLDIYEWSIKTGKPYEPFTDHDITVEDLLACAKYENVSFEQGDILIIRSGYTVQHDSCDTEGLDKMRKDRTFAGVEQSEGMLEFLHDHYFAGVAGDAPSFESMPPKTDYFLHEFLLASWGIPIGEFWDLEKLSKTCIRENRWEFFLSSKVLNVPGGIASPPNVMAIF